MENFWIHPVFTKTRELQVLLSDGQWREIERTFCFRCTIPMDSLAHQEGDFIRPTGGYVDRNALQPPIKVANILITINSSSHNKKKKCLSNITIDVFYPDSDGRKAKNKRKRANLVRNASKCQHSKP